MTGPAGPTGFIESKGPVGSAGSSASPQPPAATAPGVRASLDEAPLSMFHLKASVVAGAGFFTDSYDLNVIGTVLLLVGPEFGLGSGEVSLVSSATLLAVAVGALVFGRLGDLLGRRRVYGLEAALMIVGALVSACAPDFGWLLAGRLILGLGIGGDYPASGVIMAEFANRRNRGRLVGLTFLFYVLGQVAAYLTALLVLAVGTPHDIAWRLVLGLGALPSLFVLWNRRHMPESPRWTLDVAGRAEQAAEDLARFSRGAAIRTGPPAPVRARLSRVVRGRRFLLTLLGTAGAWFFFNVAVYGNSVSQPLLIAAIAPRTSELANVAINACLVVCFSLTAAVVGLALLDRVRRRRFQIAGFALSALAMLLISAVGGLTHTVVPFAIVFGASLFGIAVGPNYTTMLLAAESFPTAVRSTGHGLSAGIAKIGAFVGALVTPLALGYFGLRVVTLIAGGCFLLGIVTTLVLPEPKDRVLDEGDGGDAAQSAHEAEEAVTA